MMGNCYVQKGVTTMSMAELISRMVDAFEEKYGYRMSKRSMDILIAEKDKLLDIVKKNTYLPSELLEPTT